MAFDYSLDFKQINFRRQPELYRIGKGEQGVLSVEPYKSEILPFWRFKTPKIAEKSAQEIYALFLDYKKAGDFVGMDMARKFLQMGITRARRYANHKSGRKYDAETGAELPLEPDAVKAQSAVIFRQYYLKAKEDAEYIKLKAAHQEKYELSGN